jgi:AraC-like DNA-binding protein
MLIQVFFIEESIRHDVLIYQINGFMFFRVLELIVAGVSIFTYGKRCLSLIQDYEGWLTENFSNSKDMTLSWLRRLVSYLRILWIGWLAFEILFLFFWQFQIHLIPVYLLLYILLGTIAYSNYSIGLLAWMSAQRWTETRPVIVAQKSNAYSKLDEAEIKDCMDMLDRLMTAEKLYLHETLSLRTLADRLQKDPNLISHILNQRMHKSFYDYVNAYRVEAVKDKMADPAYDHFKITEIAYECGFNSKTTFNRVFKHMTGKSPSEFKRG